MHSPFKNSDLGDCSIESENFGYKINQEPNIEENILEESIFDQFWNELDVGDNEKPSALKNYVVLEEKVNENYS